MLRLLRLTAWATLCLLSFSVASGASRLTPGATLDLSQEGSLPNTYFGSSTAIDGDNAIVAGLQPGGFGVMVAYERNGAGWRLVRHLEEIPGVDPRGFGASICLSGNTLAVLTRPSTITTNVTIFVRTSGVWSLQKTFTQNDWPMANVTCIALSGDTLCFGNPSDAPSKTAVASGIVDVFVRNGSSWSYQKSLCPADAYKGVRFGSSVAIDGSRIAVGAPSAPVGNEIYRGACYVFTRTAGVWKQSAKISDPNGGYRFQFGSTVALSGSSLLVSSAARTQLVGSPTQPYALVKGTISAFHLNAAGAWTSEGILPPPAADPDPRVVAAPQALGVKVALVGSLAVVGNPTTFATTDRSFIYQRRGAHWVQLTPIVDNGFDVSTWDPTSFDPDHPPLFNLMSVPGGSAAISGATLMIGSPNETTLAGVRSGAARFFNYSGSLAVFNGASVDAPELQPSAQNGPVIVTLGDLVINQTTKRSYTIQNTGISTLTNLAFTSNNPNVALTVPSVTTLAPQAFATVNLTIVPTDYGPWEAKITASANDGSATVKVVTDIQTNVDDGLLPPTIIMDPPTGVLRALSSFEITADVMGSEPLAYQWYHNGKPCKGCTKPTMVLSSVSLEDAGTYELQVTNDAGSAFSGAGMISVYEIDPTVTIKAKENDTIALQAPVAGPGIGVQWLLNGVPVSNGNTYSGANTSTLLIKKANALTVGRFTALINPGELDITVKGWNISVLLLPVIQGSLTPLSTLSVVNGVTFHVVTAPVATSFTFQGVPPGLVANVKTGTLTGYPTTPGAYTLRVAGINGAGTGPERSVSISVQPVDARAVGTFQGIVGRDSGNSMLGGKVTLTTSSNGLCTGTVSAGPRTAKFISAVGLQSNGNPYQVEFYSTFGTVTDHYILTLNPTTGQLSGQFQSTLSTGTGSAISGWMSPWSTSRPATLWTDYVTATLSPPGSVTTSQHTTPYGISFGTATISPNGSVIWSGRMADGSVTTATTVISGTQTSVGQPDRVEIPLNLPLYSGKGSVQGMLVLSQSNAALPNFHTASGSLDWYKMPVPGRSYAAGIPLHSLTVAGGHYSPPADGEVVLGLPVALSNAMLSYTGAGIESAAYALFLSQPFTITTKGLVLFDKPDPLSNTFTLNTAKGTFSNTLVLPDPNPANASLTIRRTATCFGVVTKTTGTGFFTLPQLPDPAASPPTTVVNSPIESGRLTIGQAN